MEAEQPNIAELVSRSQAGCVVSFERIVERFEGGLYRYLYQLVSNRHDAEDLAQETFVKAYRSLPRYRADYAFSTWLYTIAKRTAYTFLKRRKPTEPIQTDTRVDEADPAAQLAKKESLTSVWDLTRDFRPAWREALWLRYGEELSVAETAAIMETSEVRVRVVLHRARNRLNEMLKRRDGSK